MSEDAPKVNYSEAISIGVYNWLDANRDSVMSIISESVKSAISISSERAIDQMTAGVMIPVGQFFTENNSEIKTAIAAAIATSWAARQHPSPKQ
jgi:hypothetical protein